MNLIAGLADRVYGLSEWADGKRRRDSHDVEQRVHMIPVRARDTQNGWLHWRLAGCDQ